MLFSNPNLLAKCMKKFSFLSFFVIFSFYLFLPVYPSSRWAGGFVNWGYPLRVRHITTGRYLAYNDNREVCLVNKEEASVAATAFGLRQTKVSNFQFTIIYI